MFALSDRGMLGLWKAQDVRPAVPPAAVPAAAPAAGCELCFTLADRSAVDACLARWEAQSVAVLQRPCDMDFGYTFTVADLDGHRVRVFAPA
jgi:hypothetical protein